MEAFQPMEARSSLFSSTRKELGGTELGRHKGCGGEVFWVSGGKHSWGQMGREKEAGLEPGRYTRS